MKKKNIAYYFICFILMLPFLRPRTLEDFPELLQDIYKYYSLVSSIIIILFVTFNKKSNLKKVLLILSMMATYIIITLIRNPEFYKSISNCIFFVGIALFVNYNMNNRPKDFIKLLAFMYTVPTIINNILVLIYPTGFYQSVVYYHHGHLLGDDNAIIYFTLPAMIILALSSYAKNKKISLFAWVNIVLCEFIFLKLWAASAMIAFALFIGLLMIGFSQKLISPNKMFLGLIAFILVILVGTNTPFITNFVTEYLKKDITFSNRTYLWAHGIELIKERPFFGYGGYYIEGRMMLSNHRLYPVHTTYLQLLVDGGIFLFGQFVLIVKIAFSKLEKFKTSKYSQILTAGMMAIGVSYLFEQSGLYHLMILIPIIINIDKLVETEEVNND